MWAVKGAEQRLVEIAQEAKAIFAKFPELRAKGRGFAATSGTATVGGADEGTNVRRRGRRRKMSAAARKKISDAQKARWAASRAKRAVNAAASEPASKGSSRKKK